MQQYSPNSKQNRIMLHFIQSRLRTISTDWCGRRVVVVCVGQHVFQSSAFVQTCNLNLKLRPRCSILYFTKITFLCKIGSEPKSFNISMFNFEQKQFTGQTIGVKVKARIMFPEGEVRQSQKLNRNGKINFLTPWSHLILQGKS